MHGSSSSSGSTVASKSTWRYPLLAKKTAATETLLSVESSAAHLTAADYTVMVEGLPTDGSIVFESIVSALRSMFGKDGRVLAVCVPRANRDFLLLVRKRQQVKESLESHRSACSL